ncbi:MAG TPA: HAD family hydrolase [Terracidiphilus sp.]|nr:HAD family hydrolase [Terracidiphilus sp.]
MDASRYISLAQNLRTVFLDRDGVLNEKMPEGSWVTSAEEFRVLPGVPEAVARLNRAGLRVLVVSNQRGIALGRFSLGDVEAIHASLQQALQAGGGHVDAFFFCPHDRGQCNCRKPLTGMFDQAKERFSEILPATSVMIGDSLSDIEFGHRLGMLTIFLDGDPERQHPDAKNAAELADLHFASLGAAVDFLLKAR